MSDTAYTKHLAALFDSPGRVMARVALHQFDVAADAGSPAHQAGYGYSVSVAQPPCLSLCCLLHPDSAAFSWSQVHLRNLSALDPFQAVLTWLARLPDPSAALAPLNLAPASPPALPAALALPDTAGWPWQGCKIVLSRELMPVWTETLMTTWIKLSPGAQMPLGSLVRCVRLLAAHMLAYGVVPRAVQRPLAEAEWL